MHTPVVEGAESMPFSPRRLASRGHSNEEASGPGLGAPRERTLCGDTANKPARRAPITPFKTGKIIDVGFLRQFGRAHGACLRADSGDFGALRGEAAVRLRDDGCSI